MLPAIFLNSQVKGFKAQVGMENQALGKKKALYFENYSNSYIEK